MSEIGKGGSQKVVGRNVAIVLGIICIILGGLLGGSIYNYTSIISSKDSQIGTLMNQSDRLKSNLEGNITYYSSQIASLQAKISDLQNQMVQKETQIIGLQNQISEKDKTIAEMNTEISNLKIQITNLQSQTATLQDQISQKDKQISSLNDRIVLLESQIRELQDIVQLRKTVTLEQSAIINLPANSGQTAYYSTPYAGYIRIDFTATGPVYFWIGSSYTGTYYSRYPSTDTVTSGSFLVPVFPGTTYVYIYHPALLIGATVTLTITYIY